MSYKGVDGRGRYGNEVGNSLRNKRRTDGGERGCKPKGAYKEVPRPSRRLGLAIIKSSLILCCFHPILHHIHYVIVSRDLVVVNLYPNLQLR